MHKNVMDAILAKIKEYDTVMLFRHFRPDGDAKGSTKGLQRILQLSFPEKQILLILNSQEMVEAICSNSASMNVYKAITGKYKNLGISVIVGSYPNSNIPYNAPEIFKKLKEDKHFLIFENLATVKCIDFPLSVQRENKKELEAGDCFYVKENVFMRIKLALDS